MSLTPDPSFVASTPPSASPELALGPQRTRRRRQSPLQPATVALISFAVGLFLMVFPWTDDWNINYIQQISPRLQDLWDQDSFRGAFTGLGLVNIYIACLQIARLFRRN
jgi:hypothetical protein